MVIRTLRITAAAALAAAGALAALSCGRAEIASAPAERPPVFLISIDTLRSDRLPAYGYAGGSTPAIDALRRDAVLFRNAFANVPSTLPSHASLFTGQLPHEHGVRDNVGYTLREGAPTLASILARHGYETGGAVSSVVLRRETGVAEGFETYDDGMTTGAIDTFSSWQRDGETTRRALTAWIDSAAAGRPLFGFLHLYEPHFPYVPPEPFASELEDPYDGEIASADAVVGRFLETLREKGLYDRSVIVLLSDHGEGLGDHGELEHGVFLYREAIQVPLIVKLPGNARASTEIARPVSLTDVLPTILAVAGLEAPEGIDGLDLFSPLPADRFVSSESYYGRLHYGWSELFSRIGERFHFIEAPSVELYDYRDDPRETRNLAAEQRRLVTTLRQNVQATVTAHPFEKPRPIDPETMRKLESLGYLGGGSDTSGPRADPKEKIGMLARFGRGATHLQKREYDRAIEVGRAIVAENPDFLQGWGLIAAAWREKGDLARAIEATEAQMMRDPGNPQIAISLASLHLQAGHPESAIAHAEIARDSLPSLAWETIASAEVARGALDRADDAASRAAAASPMRVQPLLIRSQIRRARNDAAGELSMLDEARQRIAAGQAPPVPELELRRGEALLQVRRVTEAEAAFRAETERFPRDPRAWAKLALVVGAQGRRQEARAVLRQALEANPGAPMQRAAREALEIMGERDDLRALALEAPSR